MTSPHPLATIRCCGMIMVAHASEPGVYWQSLRSGLTFPKFPEVIKGSARGSSDCLNSF